MITCKKCKKFAKFVSIKINGNGDVKDCRVKCKKHGITEGDYDDFEELGIDEEFTANPNEPGLVRDKNGKPAGLYSYELDPQQKKE